MKLAIISHTEHYRDGNGNLVGWGPTISEINHLSKHFEEIFHLAYFYEKTAPLSSLPYTNRNITFVALPVSGGKTLGDKLNILSKLTKTIRLVNKTLKNVDVFQLRTPTGIGVYLIPYLKYFHKNKRGWFKYAGNWAQENPPLGYAIQRRLLKKQYRIVTINGKWPNQEQHCLTFENPCLTLKEREEGIKIIDTKNYDKPFSFCFVGRLEDEKGVKRILDSVTTLADTSFIKAIHFIGDGPKRKIYETFASENNIPAIFHGFLNRGNVFEIYRSCEFLLLPSTASEGFPKVIAEGLNFGCIPIVSSVSSIGQYINSENGYIVEPTNAKKLHQILLDIEQENNLTLKNKAKLGYQVAENFTFRRHINRILTEILKT